MHFFDDIPQLPEDPILGLPIAFAADPRPNKINLGIGSYKTAEGQPLVLNSVRKAETILLQKNLNKEYLPIEGDGEFIRHALKLLLGAESPLFQKGNYFAAQTVGGASALRIAGEFLAKLVSKNIFICQPTWTNHRQIFERAGFNVNDYPYFDPRTHQLDFVGMTEAISSMPPGSVILLHGCCHNPTGIDPTLDQWKTLSELIKRQKIIPFFDMAYQGFGKGLEEDAEAIRYFVKEGHELLIAYSFSKNFGLYGERVGFLSVVCSSPNQVPKIGSQIKRLIRGNYSNPPLHGARIITTILKSHELTQEWKGELRNMRDRVQEMRKALMAALYVKGGGRRFSYMNQQTGLFSYTGLTPEQVDRLKDEKAIHMPVNGRINVAGLNAHNLSIVADALLSVL